MDYCRNSSPNKSGCFNSISNKISNLDWSKLKTFTNDELNVLKVITSVFHTVENIEEKVLVIHLCLAFV